jgi:cysteine sulfinate desulfinase/cysteine desulfurase-like protein
MGGGGPSGPEAWREANVNDLTDLGNLDAISGFPVYKCLLAEVRRIEGGPPEGAGQAARPTWRRDPPAAAGEAPSAAQGPERASGGPRIYLDNNATTALHPEVLEAMAPFLEREHGNPSSLHGAGRAARDAVEGARRRVAALINCRPRRLLFTGGGSEADNLALKGVAFARLASQGPGAGPRPRPGEGCPGGIVVSAVEHPAVLQAAGFLERMGFRVVRLEVDGRGLLAPGRLERALEENGARGVETLLVSVMMANNEVGTLFPVKELAAVSHAHGALFHTDAVQAAGKVPLDVEDLGADLLSLSAHKIHGPKGVGALFAAKGVALEPLVHGGKQEGGLRAGTENVAAIVGFGKAAELARTRFSPG